MPSEQSTNLAEASPPPQNPGAGIDYELFLDCVHCGLCTASCPTYAELGNENDGPRGRIHLMRAVTDGRLELDDKVRHHLELCLDCRACETACPSGVQYGRLIEPFRVAMEEQGADGEPAPPDWFHRWVLFGLMPYPDRLKKALAPARVAQALRLDRLAMATGLTRLLPPQLRGLVEMLPQRVKDEGPLPAVIPPIGEQRATVALFTGCVGEALFRHVHWATARVLAHNGCEVRIPQGQTCCGAIHFHAGQSPPAREFADENTRAFRSDDLDAVITNVAGCGAMLKDYGHHWSDERTPERQALANKVRDVHEFLAELGPIEPRGKFPAVATYHDACHLAHAQGVRDAPRQLLAMVPELDLRPLPESELCCGAAGTYNLVQPEMAERLSDRKLSNIHRTGAALVISANAGCTLQIARASRREKQPLQVLHPMEILDHSYRTG